MSKVPSDSLCNAEMIVEYLRPQLEVTTKDIEPVIIMGLYHHRDLIGSRDAFMESNLKTMSWDCVNIKNRYEWGGEFAGLS